MYKIGIMGVHGAGKTSLGYLLSAHFKMKGINVKLIHESVRENCPFPINADANQGTCLWNFHTQFRNELDAEAQGYELAICDRTVVDTFVYYHAVNKETNVTMAAVHQGVQWLKTYDVLICTEPSTSVELFDDGVRDTDIEYQNLIKSVFDDILYRYAGDVAERVIYATSDDIFDEERKEALVAKIELHLKKFLNKDAKKEELSEV